MAKKRKPYREAFGKDGLVGLSRQEYAALPRAPRPAEEPCVTPAAMLASPNLLRQYIDVIPLELLRAEKMRREAESETARTRGVLRNDAELKRKRKRYQLDPKAKRVLLGRGKWWPRVDFHLSPRNQTRVRRALARHLEEHKHPRKKTFDVFMNEILDYYFTRRRIRDSL